MIHIPHLKELIADTLEVLGPKYQGEAAEQLLLGTALVESRLKYLKQINGPALGIWQMEPDTHADMYRNFLDYKPELRTLVWTFGSDAQDLIGNLPYACAMARLKYYRDPKPIPKDLTGQAEYWKRVYNTEGGAGTVEKYLLRWNRYAIQEPSHAAR